MIRSEKHDEKADVYSYGVVLWELLTGEPPWEGLNPMQVVAAVGFQGKTLPCPDGPGADPFLADLCERCMVPAPAARPGFPEILEALEAELPRNMHSTLSNLSAAGSAAGEPASPAARGAPATSPFAGPDATPPPLAALSPEDSAAALGKAEGAAPQRGALSLETPFAGLAPFSDGDSDGEEDGGKGTASAASSPPPVSTRAQPTERLGSAATTDRSFELLSAEMSRVASMKSTLDDVGRWGGRQPAAPRPAKAPARGDSTPEALLAASMASAQL